MLRSLSFHYNIQSSQLELPGLQYPTEDDDDVDLGKAEEAVALGAIRPVRFAYFNLHIIMIAGTATSCASCPTNSSLSSKRATRSQVYILFCSRITYHADFKIYNILFFLLCIFRVTVYLFFLVVSLS